MTKALAYLNTARQAVTDLMDPYLQTQIDLWLADLYRQRGEHAAAEETLARAESYRSKALT